MDLTTFLDVSQLDKTAKALSYLEAALAFVESAIAMETEPQTPKSAYTMFSETLDLIRCEVQFSSLQVYQNIAALQNMLQLMKCSVISQRRVCHSIVHMIYRCRI